MAEITPYLDRMFEDCTGVKLLAKLGIAARGP
jgi:hypothetical protein